MAGLVPCRCRFEDGWGDDACLNCFGGKVIQLLQTFKDIHEERSHRDIASNNRIGSTVFRKT